MAKLKAELTTYKKVAMGAFPDLSSWDLWVMYCFRLSVWYKVASEGALVASSASVERLFSMLASQIQDSQSRALSDYQTATVLFRYNSNSRLQTSTIVVLIFFKMTIKWDILFILSVLICRRIFFTTPRHKKRKNSSTQVVYFLRGRIYFKSEVALFYRFRWHYLDFNASIPNLVFN